jgi:L-cystine uptake protein TcyP (sodium:dicarboxylate symporter family)
VLVPQKLNNGSQEDQSFSSSQLCLYFSFSPMNHNTHQVGEPKILKFSTLLLLYLLFLLLLHVNAPPPQSLSRRIKVSQALNFAYTSPSSSSSQYTTTR